MPRVLKRPKVENDLEEIWWYIAQDNPVHADRLLDRIEEHCLALSSFPQTGTNRHELLPCLRSFPVGNYIVFYFPLDDGIDIVRILNGVRDINADFFSDARED
ncbi:MAG: type II toxin-antitoxin system RelE/ParE family toxin [Magnetococcales bacterium]|nr:type II toxin-antitoxin system RelE/ParE family toxin [Magnetococcales bacterium]